MPRFRLIAVTQRVEVIEAYGERRDSLDQRWYEFLAACGLSCLPMPNLLSGIADWLSDIKPNGLLLSGGNDLTPFGGNAPERDQAENDAVDWATRRNVPVIGVCRGMQLLAYRSGFKIERCDGHVATRHKVAGDGKAREVNSYHGWCVKAASPDWQVKSMCADGTIEEMRHQSLPHAAIMWHPERETQFHDTDTALFRAHFNLKS